MSKGEFQAPAEAVVLDFRDWADRKWEQQRPDGG
jgi:hypothetical protein